ncbi:MAG TPA: ABC transporter substrate-binding protein [Rhodopila sp.]|uniref:ABC transporter substrate-binding protein n=1 Tax=Rhodopila sp. TaxID=2480087 RepID=UPI002C2A7B33|nr:ABC transporter substrate-binding protein [Rhodopila sp.]HVY17073.1 ABC transporter substrate-binding protein [Rhodopila sp.]
MTALSAALALTVGLRSAGAETLDIGIGIQDTTTNTVTGGVVLQQLGLFKKLLPKTGKYKNITYSLSWQNFTSGPPITNGMMANNIQIGMMGDYPLLVDGATGQATGNATELVAILAYNAHGGGNGIVVNKDTPLYDFDDLKGKTVSVPFGSAAHGMLLRALQMHGLTNDFWNLVSQSPEIGTTNLQQKRIDAHADFVPFPELLPFRGFARKIYDGAETGVPTLHAVIVRKDFADKYPEVVVAYIEAVMQANDWFRSNPQLAATKIEDWTKINKEVAYIYLGPDGIMTLDPTIKPAWVAALKTDYGVLQHLNMIKPLDIDTWINDTYVRQAFKNEGRDYDKQLKSMASYDVKGRDPVCKTPITNPAEAGQVWIRGGDIVSFSSPVCTLLGVRQYQAAGKALNAVYLVDHQLGIKVFADEAFFAVNDKDPKKPAITPFLLKRDAEAYAKANGGRLATYAEAIKDVADFTP